jgi:hypothetical protein
MCPALTADAADERGCWENEDGGLKMEDGPNRLSSLTRRARACRGRSELNSVNSWLKPFCAFGASFRLRRTPALQVRQKSVSICVHPWLKTLDPIG